MTGLRLIALLAGVSFCIASSTQEQEREFLSKYKGDVSCPAGLYAAHAKLAKALKAGNEKEVRSLLLPGAVAVKTERRKANRFFVRNLNLHFGKTAFTPHILALRKEAVDCMLLRTRTSYIRYVKTASGSWRIYDYGDKPIK